MEITNKTTLDQVRELQRKETDYKIKYRLLIIYLAMKLKSGPQIADLLNIGKDQVYYWVDRYNREGYRGLFDKERSGRPRKIQYEELKTALSEKPTDYGLEADYWTVDLIHEYLKVHQNVSISKNYIYEVLKSENIEISDEDIKMIDISSYVTKSGHRITPLHLEVLDKASELIEAPIHKIITQDGIKPQLRITYSDKHETILQGEVQTGRLTIRYTEYTN